MVYYHTNHTCQSIFFFCFAIALICKVVVEAPPPLVPELSTLVKIHLGGFSAMINTSNVCFLRRICT